MEFAYRRRMFKELAYVKRSKPTVRRRLKAQKPGEYDKCCAECGEALSEKYTVLDRRDAAPCSRYAKSFTAPLLKDLDISWKGHPMKSRSGPRMDCRPNPVRIVECPRGN